MRLETTSRYHAGASLVEVLVYFANDAGDVFHPEQVTSGFAELRTTGSPIARQEFDKYAGNSDGAIRVFFLNPSIYESQWPAISVYTEVVSNDVTYRQEVSVEVESAIDDHIPLEGNGDANESFVADEGGIQQGSTFGSGRLVLQAPIDHPTDPDSQDNP